MRTSMKLIVNLSAVCALALPLLNCTSSPHAPDEKYYLVAVNIKLPYWQAAARGLIRAANQMQVKAEMVGPPAYDAHAQRDEFQRVVGLKPSGILVSPGDPGLMRRDIDAAIAAGIPVITMDSDAPASKRLLFIGTNNYQAGLMGGRTLAKLLNGKGSVVVYTMPGQANLDERLIGYRTALADHPQIKIAQVIDIKGDPRIAFDTTTEMAEKGKLQADAFVCLEAIAGKEVAEVLNRHNIKDKVIVAMDTDLSTLEWIEKGMIAATIAQKPFTMAYYGLKMLDDLHHHKPPQLDIDWAANINAVIPTLVDTGATLVDKSNVAAFLKEVQPAANP